MSEQEKEPVIPTDLLTPRQAGALLGVDGATVRRWIKAGKLPGFKLVGRVRVSKADVLALLVQHVPDCKPRPQTQAEIEASDAETDRILRAPGVRK